MEFNQEEFNQTSLSRFESMLKTNSVLFFDSEEFEGIIHYYLNQGKMAKAKKAIKLGLQQHPTSINLRLFKVEIFVFEDKLKEANVILEELYTIEPSNEEIYIQKANIFSKEGNHGRAIEALHIALDLAEDVVEIYSLIGMEYLFMDKFEEAKEQFINCLDADLEDYSSLYNIVYCFDFLEQPKEAVKFLTKYVDQCPYSEVAWHQLGKQYFNLEDYKKALTAFDFAIISDDTFLGAYIEKAKVLERLKRYKEAIENYEITLGLDDPTSFALLRIGFCYEKLGNNELALEYYNKTIKEDPLLDKGWVAITKYYCRKNDYKKALYYINEALETDTENVKYWKQYAVINLRLDMLEESEYGFKRTLELGNYELNTWLSRGDVLVKLGEEQAASYCLLQAAEFYPENPEIEFRLAGVYFKLKDTEKGSYHLKNALRYDSDFLMIVEELFPKVYESKTFKSYL